MENKYWFGLAFIVVLVVLASINNYWTKSGDKITYDHRAEAGELCLKGGTCYVDRVVIDMTSHGNETYTYNYQTLVFNGW